MPALTRQEIAQLFIKARRVVRHPGLDILMAPATSSLGRIVVVTSRKVGNAPERNKVRRRLKAIFYEQQLAKHGFDCIVIIKVGGVDLPFQALQELLIDAFSKAQR